MHMQVIAIFFKVLEKQRNLFEILIAHISGMAEGIFFKFGMWPPLSGGHQHYIFLCQLSEALQSYKCMKIVT